MPSLHEPLDAVKVDRPVEYSLTCGWEQARPHSKIDTTAPLARDQDANRVGGPGTEPSLWAVRGTGTPSFMNGADQWERQPSLQIGISSFRI